MGTAGKHSNVKICGAGKKVFLKLLFFSAIPFVFGHLNNHAAPGTSSPSAPPEGPGQVCRATRTQGWVRRKCCSAAAGPPSSVPAQEPADASGPASSEPCRRTEKPAPTSLPSQGKTAQTTGLPGQHDWLQQGRG